MPTTSPSPKAVRSAGLFVLGLALLTLLAACGPGAGTYEVRIYGEAFIEEGIPAEELVDGWAISFDCFLVSVGEIASADAHGTEIAAFPTWRAFDLTLPSDGAGHLVEAAEVAAGPVAALDYRMAYDPSVTGANTDAVADLASEGCAVYVEGAAERDGVVKTFAWCLTTDTRYVGCATTAVVTPDEVGTSQLTIHADHLFYDDLVSQDPNVTFDLIASADVDDDGDVTSAELAAVDITGEDRYQVGSADVEDLWSFIEAQSTTLGHIDGEGHCDRE